MKALLAIFVITLVSSQSAPDYSSKRVQLTVELSTSGAMTPPKNYNKAQDPEQNFRLENYITPLGQR